MAHYPADTFKEATELAIEASNQLHGIINGDANAEVIVEDGSKIPSVRKAMVDSLYFLPPIAWAQGEYENTYNQLREFVDGDARTWWFAKGATVSTPVLMSTNPATDINWTLWGAVTLNAATYETQKRLAAEAGLNMVGSFLLGATATNTDDVVFYETDGKYYGWGGTLPKTVSANSTPETSGGVGALLWADRTDIILRASLAATTGAGLVGTTDGITVQAKLNAIDTAIANNAALALKVNTSVMNAPFTAELNTIYFVDTSLGNVTVQMPTPVNVESKVIFVDYKGSWADSPCVLTYNTNKYNGTSEDFFLDLNWVSTTVQWSGNNNIGWRTY